MTELVWVEQQESYLEVHKIAQLPPAKPCSEYARGCKRQAYYHAGTHDGEEVARGAITETWPWTQRNFAFVEIRCPGAEARVRTYLEKLAAALVELEGP